MLYPILEQYDVNREKALAYGFVALADTLSLQKALEGTEFYVKLTIAGRRLEVNVFDSDTDEEYLPFNVPDNISGYVMGVREKVEELLQLSPDICSLDVPTGDGEKGTLGTLLEDLEAPQPQEELVRKELEEMLDKLLGSLTPRQQTILRLHFGMEDGTCYSLEAIGEKLGISKERVRQVEKQAMDKLQAMGTSMGLEDFLE